MCRESTCLFVHFAPSPTKVLQNVRFQQKGDTSLISKPVKHRTDEFFLLCPAWQPYYKRVLASDTITSVMGAYQFHWVSNSSQALLFVYIRVLTGFHVTITENREIKPQFQCLSCELFNINFSTMPRGTGVNENSFATCSEYVNAQPGHRFTLISEAKRPPTHCQTWIGTDSNRNNWILAAELTGGCGQLQPFSPYKVTTG